MLKRMYPDEKKFVELLDFLNEKDLRLGCRKIVEKALIENSFKLDDFDIALESISSTSDFNLESFNRMVTEYDEMYDQYMENLTEDSNVLELKGAEKYHRQARAISALCCALSLDNYRRSAEECIYEAMHSSEDVSNSYKNIKKVFGLID